MICVVPSQRNPLEHTFANQINILTQHMVDFPYWKLHNSTIPQRDEEQFLVNRLVSLEKNPMEHLLIIFINKDLTSWGWAEPSSAKAGAKDFAEIRLKFDVYFRVWN